MTGFFLLQNTMEQPDSVNGAGEDVDEIELDVVSTDTPSATPSATLISVNNVTSPTPIDVDSVSPSTPVDADSVPTPIDVDRVINTIPVDADSISDPTLIDVDSVNNPTPIDVDSVNNPTPIDVDSFSTPMPIDVDSVNNHFPLDVHVDVVDTQTPACSVPEAMVDENKIKNKENNDKPGSGIGKHSVKPPFMENREY